MHHIPLHIRHQAQTVPVGKRVPFGWQAAAIGGREEEDMVITWSQDLVVETESEPIRFRLTVALDEREEKEIELSLAVSGRVLGTMDVRFAPLMQTHEWLLDAEQARQIMQEGMRLRLLRGNSLLWIFIPDDRGESRIDPLLLPHLYVKGDNEASTRDAFLRRMDSLAVVESFGWMEGCVLDGLYDLGLADAVRQHLSLFLDDDGRLIYEDPRSQPSDDIFYDIESTLPVAILAKCQPEHPVVQRAVDFLLSACDELEPDAMLSAEGSYTIAYPLAVIAAAWQRQNLAQEAIKQLKVRQAQLPANGALYLRAYADGSRTFRNWGRAYAWHALGLIRSLAALKQGGLLAKEAEQELAAAYVQTIEAAFACRQIDGSWSVYIDEPDTGIDTSATAGIAAAAAIGVRLGYLPTSDYRHLLEESSVLLHNHLTPDGLLGGAAQSNKDGERLQRSGYRVLSSMAMGLYGQLLAALRSEEQ